MPDAVNLSVAIKIWKLLMLENIFNIYFLFYTFFISTVFGTIDSIYYVIANWVNHINSHNQKLSEAYLDKQREWKLFFVKQRLFGKIECKQNIRVRNWKKQKSMAVVVWDSWQPSRSGWFQKMKINSNEKEKLLEIQFLTVPRRTAFCVNYVYDAPGRRFWTNVVIFHAVHSYLLLSSFRRKWFTNLTADINGMQERIS